MRNRLPEFNLTTDDFKQLKSIKSLQQHIYFKYNGEIYACQHFDGFEEKLYYNRKR